MQTLKRSRLEMVGSSTVPDLGRPRRGIEDVIRKYRREALMD
jgi:hypothetical protein